MRFNQSSRLLRSPLGLAASTALGAGMLAGYAAAGPIHPDKLIEHARAELAKGRLERAVTFAEQAVAADPRTAQWRVVLGDAYLRSGRFIAAKQAYEEALQLGDDKGRTALGLALSNIALGHLAQATDTLAGYRDSIPAADYGLALALAGQPNQGIAILGDTLRAGENTAKVRQNLAYAYALSGRWAQAQVMAAQDLPADKVDARIAEWAQAGRPEDHQKRVAMLIGAPLRGDSGEPAALALNAAPGNPQSRSAAADLPAAQPAERAPALASASTAELPALASIDAPVAPAVTVSHADPESADFHVAPATDIALIDAPAYAGEPVPAPIIQPRVAPRMVSQPVVQPIATPPAPRIESRPGTAAVRRRVEAEPVAPRPRALPHPAFAAAPVKAGAVKAPAAKVPAVKVAVVTKPAPAAKGTHLVQLGAFATPEGAKIAMRHLVRRNPALAGYKLATNRAEVNGKVFYRLTAQGFTGKTAASACGSVRARGGNCFVRLDGKPIVPGTVRVPTQRFAKR